MGVAGTIGEGAGAGAGASMGAGAGAGAGAWRIRSITVRARTATAQQTIKRRPMAASMGWVFIAVVQGGDVERLAL